MTRPPRHRLTLAFLLAGMLATLLSSCNWFKGPPNIVVITMDTFRADRMTAYGGSGLAPTLDSLAEMGTVFNHAVVSAGTTYPSHATMFTGLYPRTHAVRSNFSRLPDNVPTLAEALTTAGYESGAFVSFKGMVVHGNLGKGFTALSDTQVGEELFRDGAETTQMALDWLDSREDRQKPVLLWYHNFDVHLPLRATPYATRRLDEIGYEGPWRDGASIKEVTSIQSDIVASDHLQAAITALYDGEVQKADKAVETLLEGLKSRGLLDNTVLVLLADHGEALGENGWFGHGAILWESVIHTPMVVVDFRDPHPAEVDSTVGTVDLYETLLELAGAEAAPNQGRSLVPALRGEPIESTEYLVEVEMREEQDRPAWYDVNRLAVFYEDLKMEYVFGEPKLFDLGVDPYALHPIASDDTELAALTAYLEGIAEDFLAGGKLSNQSDLDNEAIEQLRSLGYVQ